VKPIRSFDNGTANVTGMVNGSPVFMFQVGNEVLLPVVPGQDFGLSIRNETQAARAFPAVFGNGQDWRNVYVGCDVVDPTLMPPKGGMWEAQKLGDLDLDAFALPGGQKRYFVAEADGLGYEGIAANQLVVWERPPVDPNAKIVEPPSENAGYTTRDGAVIGAGAVQNGERIVTDLDYQPVATKLAHVRIVTRDEAAALVSQHGGTIASWDQYSYYGEWTDVNIKDLTV
jgi:hypothetical protein